MSIDTTTPTVGDVAAIIRARTKDSNGNELGTFTPETRPTDLQCQEAIDHQMVLLHTRVGNIGAGCVDVARLCAAYGAAAEIELSYFPEQARTDRSPYLNLIARYNEYADGLVACVEGNLPSDPDDAGDITSGLRYGTLDAVSGTVEGFYTGRVWPPIAPPPPAPAPSDGDDG
jgi:hypothetical protein